MKRSAPMKRGAPIERKPFNPKAPARPPRADRAPPVLGTLKPLRMGVLARIDGAVRASPKTIQYRNRRLLDLARGMPCLLGVPGICNRDDATTVAAHSNWGEHGKAGARKADDYWSCWACSACHEWLDQNRRPLEAEKRAAFDRGHALQLVYWHQIAADPARHESDRLAAQWALALIATARQPGNDPLFNRVEMGP